MPLRLEIKKKLTSRSERVKCVDLHPSEPLILSALYTGALMVWNYETQTLLKSFEATTQPIRCAKFISRKQWIVSGADDMMVRIYNYNTLEKVKEFEAHIDYIRSLEVHPTLPYVLTASDDMQIKLWDWEKNWTNTQSFDGHAHYIMCIKFNPKDTNTFATASLDRSVKIWGLGSGLPNYSLEGHEQGVNSVDYFIGGEKPYIVSGADDLTVKIWDYQTKTCVQTLEGHTGNVSTVLFHPKLPLILSGSEDGTLRLWHSTTYRLETTLNYGLERVWCVSAAKSVNRIGIAYDEGTVVVALGQDEVVCSMESVNGKVLIVKNNEVSVVSVRGTGATAVDGEPLELTKKELGSCELFPQRILHNTNGRFVAIIGDGEYIIYTAQALRNKAYGSCLDFIWSSENTGDYCVLSATKKIKLYKNFVEGLEKTLSFSIDKMQGGPFIGLINSEFVVFLDWERGEIVRKIDVTCEKIIWNQTGELVAIVCEDSFYVLSVNQAQIQTKLAEVGGKGQDLSDLFENCFELVNEVAEGVNNGCFVGDCFLYVNKLGTKLNYYINGENATLSNLDKKMFLLNYVAKENRVYLIDMNFNVVSYELLESVLQYQTAVVRKDFELANEILPKVPEKKYDDIARFLESQGYKEVALNVARDKELKYDLALQLQDLNMAFKLMNEFHHVDNLDENEKQENEKKWRLLSDLCLSKGELELAEQCAKYGNDLACLLLIYTSVSSKKRLKELMLIALKEKEFNIAFTCAYLLADVSSCIHILQLSNRYAEASFFARSYCPSKLKDCVVSWKDNLKKTNPVIAASIANVDDTDEMGVSLFPAFEESLRKERLMYGDLTASLGKLNISSPVTISKPSNREMYADVDKALEESELASNLREVAEEVDDLLYSEPPALPSDLEAEEQYESNKDLLNLVDTNFNANEHDPLGINENELDFGEKQENLADDVEYYDQQLAEEDEGDDNNEQPFHEALGEDEDMQFGAADEGDDMADWS